MAAAPMAAQPMAAQANRDDQEIDNLMAGFS